MKEEINEIRKITEKIEDMIDYDYGHTFEDLIIEALNKIADILDKIDGQKL